MKINDLKIEPVFKIKKNRVSFRAWEEGDIAYLYKWMNEPEVLTYLGTPFPSMSLQHTIEYFNKRKSEPNRYLIAKNENFEPIGTCRIFNVDMPSRRGELSIIIGEQKLWGQGYGVDVLMLLEDIAFKGLGLNRLGLHCFCFNERARKLYEKCGFKIDGKLRKFQMCLGEYQDVYVMSLLSEEYFEKLRCNVK